MGCVRWLTPGACEAQSKQNCMRQLKNFLPIGVAVCLFASVLDSHAQTVLQPSGVPPQAVGDRAADLESQLIDLQVRIATMRSMAANAAPAVTRVAPQSAFQGGAPAPNSQRVAALEAEVRTLSAQAQKLSGRPTLILPQATIARQPASAGQGAAGGFAGQTTQPGVAPGAAAGGWAGSTTVLPNSGLAPGTVPGQFQTQPGIAGQPAGPQSPRQFVERSPGVSGAPQQGLQGELLPGNVYPGYENVERQRRVPQGTTGGSAGWGQPAAPTAPARVARNTPPGDAETEYQTAYGYLLQQDYGAAQAAFSAFLKRYPDAALAGNAQYWLGETHYVRGAYKNAAVAFLKGYEKYGDGNKGPDSLLKLALSLGKLRQKAAACSSLDQLRSRYRNAPQPILQRAKDERRRLRCPA